MLYEIYPTGLLATLLSTFKDVGGKIDYILTGGIPPEISADSYKLHKIAAGFTIETATTRYLRSKTKGPASRRDSENARGISITPTEFFAPGYIWIPIEEIATFPHFTSEEVASYQINWNVQLHKGIGYGFKNYHHAFSYPPYALARYDEQSNLLHRLREDEREKLFSEINQELFGDDLEALTIYSWSTDWADYFNDGHIWWGSFLWTVYSAQTNLLVGVAASTSD